MSDGLEKDIPPILDIATARTAQVGRAIGHITRAVELELADIALTEGSVSDETRAKLERLGGYLLGISQNVTGLLGQITRTVEVVEDGAPYAPFELPPQQATTPSASNPHTPPAAAPASDQLNGSGNAPARNGRGRTASRIPDTMANTAAKRTGTDLYSRLIDGARIPPIQPIQGIPILRVSIEDDTTLIVGQQHIQLTDHERYILNALLLLRTQPRSSGELKQFGFFPTLAKSTAGQVFPTHMRALAAKLNQAAGLEVIKIVGERSRTRYALSPNLVIDDTRPPAQLAMPAASVKKN